MTDLMNKKIYYNPEGYEKTSCRVGDIINHIKENDRIIEIDQLTLDDIEIITKKSNLYYSVFGDPLTIVFF
jgi:regulatory protein YycI of two-component signal transduction system YycFG